MISTGTETSEVIFYTIDEIKEKAGEKDKTDEGNIVIIKQKEMKEFCV